MLMDSIIIFSGKYFIFVVVLLAVVTTIISEKAARYKLMILAGISLLLAFGTGTIAGFLYYDPRPFVVDHSVPLIPHIPNNGFPSHHTLYAMTIAAVVFVHKRKTGIALGILAILCGVARVMAGIHHAIDVVGGVAVAIIATYMSWVIIKMLLKIKILSRLLSKLTL